MAIADNHQPGDAGHVTDHNAIADQLDALANSKVDNTGDTISGDLTVNGTLVLPGGLRIPPGAAAGDVLTSDASGNAAWAAPAAASAASDIDTNASDIQPTGTSIAAGSKGLAADAGHVHTNSVLGPVAVSGTPVAGQVPTATSGTNATWQTPAAGVSLDTTAADVQALGTRAAGSTGKAADAGHVHPTTGLVAYGSTAGGDLSGTYPNPTVAKVGGVAASGTPSPGQVLTATSGTAATWQAPPTGVLDWLNVKSYGATGNGTTNDTAAIQAALNAAVPGQVVYFPVGIYVTSAPLTIPSYVTMLGPSSKVYDKSADVGAVIRPNGSFAQGSAAYNAIIAFNNPTEARVINLSINGLSLPWPGTVDAIGGTANCALLRDLFIESPSRHGVSVAGLGWRGERVVINYAGGGGFSDSSTDSTWLDCEAAGVASHGWYIYNALNNKLVGCRSEWNGGHGYWITGPAYMSGPFQMDSCSTDRNALNGVYIDQPSAAPINISNLMLRRDGSGSTTAGYAGVQVNGATAPVIINGLTVMPGTADDGTGNASPQYGVNIVGTVTYVSVTGALLHAMSANPVNGTITQMRSVAVRSGAWNSPGLITMKTDTA